MADITFNTGSKRRVPINRNNLFYDKESYDFEMQVGKEYIEQDMNQTIVLYQVKVGTTNTDAVYGEADANNIEYETPIEVHCVYKIEQPELKAYDKTKQLGVDIKNGDYIGVQINPNLMIYFVVNNDGRNNYDNSHTLWGTVPLFRTIQASPVDTTEFKA